MTTDKEALYRDATEPLLGVPGVERSTMMGFPCLRLNGKFFASMDRTSHDLIVKLPAERVRALIEDGAGAEFAPSGKAFREWVAIPTPDWQLWTALIAEAMDFASD